MNEDQADQIIALLEEIKNHLSNIGFNTSEISSVEANTNEAVKYLKQIKSNLR